MSKLADLLNPAPSSASSHPPPSPSPPPPPPINVSPPSHRRSESITSPHEAPALAATTAAPLQTCATTLASSPPNSIPPNPYAIKSQFSPPPTSTIHAHHTPASTYATSPPQAVSPQAAPHGLIQSHHPPSPEKATISSTQFDSRQRVEIPTVKTEMPDEPTLASVGAPAVPRRSETASNDEAPTIDAAPAETERRDEDMKDEDATTELKASVETASTLTPTPIRKPVQKKGTAKKADAAPKKVAPRKRKLEPESSKDATPFSQRSDTPASRVSKTPGRKNTPQQSSPPPLQDTASVADEDVEGGDYVDENEIFCVCRKPDDHTWMIGCDGGCDDWFHGHCVNMREADSDLVDKYVCPNCEAKGRGRTMWKPMCRLGGCRAPARVSGKKPSKYCSDDHGRQFMREKAYGKTSARSSKEDTTRKRRKQDKNGATGTDDIKYDDASSDDGHQAHLRGGVIRPGELKALVSSVKSFQEFRKLGDRIATPDTTDKDGDVKMGEGDEADVTAPKLQFSDEDQAKLNEIGKRKSALESELRMLGDKEKFLGMVKTRHKAVADELKKKEGVKDICGYDSRLTWSEPEFDDWRQSDKGKQALESKILDAPSNEDTSKAGTNGIAKEDGDEETGRGVCKKKKCERHKQWAKQEQNEINLARSQCWHNIRKVEGEESSLKERAMLRQLEAAN